MSKVIYITDKDLKEWQFGRRLANLRQHFEAFGSTLTRVTIECDDTVWVYEPPPERREKGGKA